MVSEILMANRACYLVVVSWLLVSGFGGKFYIKLKINPKSIIKITQCKIYHDTLFDIDNNSMVAQLSGQLQESRPRCNIFINDSCFK